MNASKMIESQIVDFLLKNPQRTCCLFYLKVKKINIFSHQVAELPETTTDCRFFFLPFCNKVTASDYVCVVILGIQTVVAIVTHQAVCRALISAPRTAPRTTLSL